MKKSTLFTLILFALILKTYGQEIKEPCGFRIEDKELLSLKDSNSTYNKRLNFIQSIPKDKLKRLKKIEFKGNKQFEAIFGVAEEIWCIPIAAHIVRRTNGSGGLSNADLNDAIQNLNDNYREFNMTFQVCEILFIDDDELFEFRFNDSSGVQNANLSSTRLNVTQRNLNRLINIYFVPESSTSWAWPINNNERRQHIIARNSQVTAGPTLTHEVGHWFNLLHTHGSINNRPQDVDVVTLERVTRLQNEVGNRLPRNCEGENAEGDLLCDTQADPHLTGRFDANCNYVGNFRDANQDLFTPDVRNFMSYGGICRNRFTEGQGQRMLNALLGMNDDRGYTLLGCGNPERHSPFRIKSISTGQFLTLRSNNNNGRIWLRDNSESGHPNQKFIAVDQSFNCQETNDRQLIPDNCFVIRSLYSGRGLIRTNRTDRILRHRSIPLDFNGEYTRLLFMPVSGKCNTYRIHNYINNESQVFLTSNENGRHLTFEGESGNPNQEFEIIPTSTRTGIVRNFSIRVDDLESTPTPFVANFDKIFITIKDPTLKISILPSQDIEEGETRIYDLSNINAIVGRVGSTIKVYEHDGEGGHDLIGEIIITNNMLNNGMITRRLRYESALADANYLVSFEVVAD